MAVSRRMSPCVGCRNFHPMALSLAVLLLNSHCHGKQKSGVTVDVSPVCVSRRKPAVWVSDHTSYSIVFGSSDFGCVATGFPLSMKILGVWRWMYHPSMLWLFSCFLFLRPSKPQQFLISRVLFHSMSFNLISIRRASFNVKLCFKSDQDFT